MGASASKQTETKVFTPSSKVEFSSSLVNQLEQTTETDYVRSQYTEKFIQDEVSKKLDQLSKESSQLFDKTLKDSILTKDDDSKDSNISSKILDDKIANLEKVLLKRESKFLKLSDDVLTTKKEIVQCLITNKDKPLNCWDEVKKFESLVNKLA